MSGGAEPASAATTLISLLQDCAKTPQRVAAVEKRNGRWTEVTWGEVAAQVVRASEALVALGVQPGERVAVFGATSLRWIVADLAISGARAITVPIYASNTSEECRFILQNSGAVACFVDADVPEGTQPGRLTRVRAVKDASPALRHVITFDESGTGAGELPWSRFEAEASARPSRSREGFEERALQLRPQDPCCFIYTSGTTGDPKGVILTHANWMVEAEGVASGETMLADDRTMLFLPLAHSFAQAIKATWLKLAHALIFAESTDKLLANLAETRPTILPSVPRVFEKVYNGIVANGLAAPGVQGKLFRWAMGLFDAYAAARLEGRELTSLQLELARKLVFSKVRAKLVERLGGKLRLFVSGGAPLSPKIAYFFELLGFLILEGYGLTETSAGATLNKPGAYRLGTVGRALPGVELKIAPDGEILIRGGVVMRGYHDNPQATAEALEPDGWFHSGDIGELDPHGFLTITDRKKDIIVTAGGKNVAPQNLEGSLKNFPIVSQAMVYGDKRKFLSVLITVNEETARRVLAEAGKPPVQHYREYASRPEVREAVQKALDTVNAHEPPHNTLRKFVLAEREFSQEGGELTPTLKVKRKACTLKYKAALDALYEGDLVD